jgi:hypothetical protein
MLARTARDTAAAWVAEQDGRFLGAYLTGSVARLPPDALLPRTSDVDVVVVTAGTDAPPKPGKFLFRGVLLEVTCLAEADLATADQVLSSYHLAGGLRTDTIIDDPTGHLRGLHVAVAAAFADPAGVRRRMADVRRRIESGLASTHPGAPFAFQVLAWLFPTGVTCHLPLVATLHNPTIRLRYPAVRAVLHDHRDVYDDLLRLLGAAELSAATVRAHLDALVRTFDATVPVARTVFPFSSDISAAARAIAIDGSRDLIDAGDHREATFWIVATLARCHMILAADDPVLHERLLPDLQAAAADLGIVDSTDIRRRNDAVLAYVPRLWQLSERLGPGSVLPAR